jgi:signal transduction histidine kinase
VTASDQTAAPTTGLGLERAIRVLPIRWRILAIAAVNVAVAIVLAALMWDGGKVLGAAWNDLRQVRDSDQLLVLVESETRRLQTLVQRYFNRPDSVVSAEILLSREALLITMRSRVAADPILAPSVEGLVEAIERLTDGFGELRLAQATIARTYESQVLKPAKDMAGLYAGIDEATGNRDSLIWPSLTKSRETYSAAVIAANSYYFSLASNESAEAQRHLATLEQTIPIMLTMAENDLQRSRLTALRDQAVTMREGLSRLADNFANRARLLRDAIDGNQIAMAAIMDPLSRQMRTRAQQAQERFDETLRNVYWNVAIVAGSFLTAIALMGIAIGHSISAPLRDLMAAMNAIVRGNYGQEVRGLAARDEIGEMARAIEVFRENAIAKQRAEEELRTSKEHAETALTELREAQRSLIEAEKLAALGGLVAGIAHEVNNPVGISLTVASSLAHRSDGFAEELASGQIRRSRLTEFVDGTRDAAAQLVHNLQRAGELIQSFKQVAVDRSHSERRQFDLLESTDQIVASLKPGVKKSNLTLAVAIPPGIVMDSYPGDYGQVLTNLFLNAVSHAFPNEQGGMIRITAARAGDKEVEIVFADNGRGMHEDVQWRVFEPFFTTRRHLGGTGLGLHIVYNLVTRRLGGRIALTSALRRGTEFRMTVPLVAPVEQVQSVEAWK